MMRGPAGRAGFLTEEEKKNAPKVTKELLGRVVSWTIDEVRQKMEEVIYDHNTGKV